MPTLMQVCVVVVTLSLVGLIIYALRVVKRLETLLEDATKTSIEVRELVNSLDRVSKSSQVIMENVERISDRARNISTVVLDEVEGPVRQAARVIRGVKAAAGVLTDRWRGHKIVATEYENGGK